MTPSMIYLQVEDVLVAYRAAMVQLMHNAGLLESWTEDLKKTESLYITYHKPAITVDFDTVREELHYMLTEDNLQLLVPQEVLKKMRDHTSVILFTEIHGLRQTFQDVLHAHVYYLSAAELFDITGLETRPVGWVSNPALMDTPGSVLKPMACTLHEAPSIHRMCWDVEMFMVRDCNIPLCSA